MVLLFMTIPSDNSPETEKALLTAEHDLVGTKRVVPIVHQKRWKLETFYNYFKNKANYASLHAEDYYKTQGLAFIMLVAALIHQEVEKATKEIDGKSLDDCLLDARMVKAHKRHGIWKLCNCLKKQVTLFMQLNTELKVI